MAKADLATALLDHDIDGVLDGPRAVVVRLGGHARAAVASTFSGRRWPLHAAIARRVGWCQDGQAGIVVVNAPRRRFYKVLDRAVNRARGEVPVVADFKDTCARVEIKRNR